MKKAKGLTKRLAVVLLSGMLVVGAVPGTVLASESPEDMGQTSEKPAEEMWDTLSEEVSTEGYAEDPSAGDVGSDIESQEIAEENTDQFDASQDPVEIDEAEEESQDVQDPVEADEAAEGSQDVQDSVEIDETAEGSQDVQDSVEADEAADETEGSVTSRDAWDSGTAGESSADENTASQAYTDPETIDENEQAVASDQEVDYADEIAEKASEESSDAAAAEEEEAQPELIGVSEEEETVSEDAAMAIVESGTCGDNLTWTLDEEGTLTISGFGNMEQSAFYINDNIKKVIIGKGCLSIADLAFFSCSNLMSITIPDSVKRIGIWAFGKCTNLTSITIPKSVTSIGVGVFNDCSSLENIFVEQGNQNYRSEDGVLFNSDQTILVCYPGRREGVYSIPDTVTSIGDMAFSGCRSLTGITIPNSFTSIGADAFFNCSSLTGITIPNSVTSIGVDAFKGCSNLLIYCYSGSKAHQYAKENNIPFKIFIGEASVTIPDQSYTYTGNRLEPEVTVSVNGTQLTKGTDYVVTYSDNIDAGSSATVTVTGTGDYYGEKEITFTIEQALQPIMASDLTLPYPESRKIMVTGNQGQLSYTSSDLSVAEVDTFGNVTAKKVGTATITITAAETKNYKKTEKEITVTVVKGTQPITASDLSLTYMETGTINVSGNVGDLTYESYNTTIATVYTNGKVTAMGAGDTKILITALETDNYKKAAKEITVNVAKAAQSITASDLSMTYPETGTIKASGNVGDLTYESGNEKVATVDTEGKVTAAGAGDAKITITAAETANYKKAAKEITVNVAKAAQSITASNLSLTYPETGTIKVSGNKGDLTYKSANEKVATVDTDGKVKAQGIGSAKVTVTAVETANYKKAEKEITVTVVKGTQPVTASNLTLTYPNSGQITVSGNKGSLTYKSSDTSVATVDSAGKVTAKSGGTAKIMITAAETAQYNAASKTITVNVARAAQSISAKASAAVVFVGQTTSVSVSGAKGATSFKSSDTSIASVTSAGKVTAKKTGTVEITGTSAATAQYNAASKTVSIKVVPAITSSLTAANQVTGIKLSWKKVTGATGYKIFRNSTLIKTITDESTVTYTDAKANTNMSRYIYKVVAKGPAGDSPLARTVTAYRVDRPALSSVTNSAASVMTAKWTTIARVSGYQIKYSTSKTFASDIRTVDAYGRTTDTMRIGKLTRGMIYYVKIRAFKLVGNGVYWSEWSPARTVRISK